jgi:hypothetical protein
MQTKEPMECFEQDSDLEWQQKYAEYAVSQFDYYKHM